MQPIRREHAEHGFSLMEVLVAIGLIVVLVTSLSQLFAVATVSNGSARVRTAASLLAAEKLEELRGLAFSLDSGGSLDQSVAGYSDHLDLFGRGTDLAGAAFVRRWSVQPLRTDVVNGRALSVAVFSRGATGQRATGPDVVRLATARTRKAR